MLAFIIVVWLAAAILYISFHWQPYVEHLTWWQIGIRIVLVVSLLPVVLLVQLGLDMRKGW